MSTTTISMSISFFSLFYDDKIN